MSRLLPSSPSSFQSTSVLRRSFHTTLPAPFLGPLAAGVAIGLVAISAKYLIDLTKQDAAGSSTGGNSNDTGSAAGGGEPKSSTSSASNASSASGFGRKRETAGSSRPRSKLEEVVGIDLGVFNVRVAVPQMEADGVLKGIRIVENADGARMTPAMIGTHGAEILVGAAAKRQLYTTPSSTLFGVKHLLGRKLNDPVAQKILQMNKVKFSDDGRGGILLNFGATSMTPVEATARLFEGARKTAEGFLGKKVRLGSFAVPHNFTEDQRAALQQAAKIAGLTPFLLTEDTVAGLYGHEFELTGDLEGGLEDKALVIDSGSRSFFFFCFFFLSDSHL